MRRKEREVRDLHKILEILNQCQVARIALCSGNRPYLVPVNFGYEHLDGALCFFFHGAKQGKKMDLLAENSRACFETDTGYSLVERDEACRWTARYQSVVGEGWIEVLEDPAEKKHGLDIIMEHHGFTGVPEYSERALEQTAVLKFHVESITGKSTGMA